MIERKPRAYVLQHRRGASNGYETDAPVDQ